MACMSFIFVENFKLICSFSREIWPFCMCTVITVVLSVHLNLESLACDHIICTQNNEPSHAIV